MLLLDEIFSASLMNHIFPNIFHLVIEGFLFLKDITKTSLFQYLSVFFIIFNLCWNWYIMVLGGTMVVFHHPWRVSLKDGCLSHNFSNLKGFEAWVKVFRDRQLGQCFEPTCGTMVASMTFVIFMRVSEMRKRSRREAVCWDPPLWLV